MSDNHSVEALTTILDSLDALVYVADLKTHDLLYLNAYGRRLFGAADGRKCWQTLQTAQAGPCEFCTNSCLADKQGNPNGVYVWEFQNTLTHRWYQCRDELIRWTDGRLVRLEVATDITDRKEMEQQLHEATRVARELAHTDELTGLNNRRAFLAYSEQSLKRSSRSGGVVSLIVFDLDFFKQINDQWGHEAGDKVLQAVARVIHPLIRSGDVLGRIGGEEFAVTMAEACHDQALALAERLRKAIAEIRVPYHGHTLRCSASFGIATEAGREIKLSQLLLRADGALYRAKDDGRDKVSSAN
ncbi:MAG: GGDEF domain-containing protein [Marinobacter sp.]|nr:GGDEF domain-containing protein [Marinobacter sp.]